MKLDARSAAARVLDDVLAGRSLDTALQQRAQQIAAKERPLLAEMAYGVCRWHMQLDALLDLLLNKRLKGNRRPVEQLIKVGLYQLLHMRIPEHAVVDQTVGSLPRFGQKWATGLVNAVLRRMLRERQQLLDKAMRNPIVSCGVPDWLFEALDRQWPDRRDEICRALQERPPMTIRVNRQRASTKEYADTLAKLGMPSRPVAGVANALVLDEPVTVDSLPGFSEGSCSVQDAGAQLAAHFLAPEKGQSVLDACAAPGGKTTHMLEFEPGCQVTAVDVDESRLARVRENLERLGLFAHVTQGDMGQPEGDWSTQDYDRILLDVPCSATGVIRRHPDIRLLRRKQDIAALVRLQVQIMENAWRLLRPGGRMLYVTCSILAQENWEQVQNFLKCHDDSSLLPLDFQGTVNCPAGIQILPGANTMDGFYYALLEKRS